MLWGIFLLRLKRRKHPMRTKHGLPSWQWQSWKQRDLWGAVIKGRWEEVDATLKSGANSKFGNNVPSKFIMFRKSQVKSMGTLAHGLARSKSTTSEPVSRLLQRGGCARLSVHDTSDYRGRSPLGIALLHASLPVLRAFVLAARTDSQVRYGPATAVLQPEAPSVLGGLTLPPPPLFYMCP